MRKQILLLACATVTLSLAGTFPTLARATFPASPGESLQEQRRGAVAGTVLDGKGSPVIGASVLFVGTSTGAITGVNGEYVVKELAAGTYAIQVSCIGHETTRVTGVQIVHGKTTPLDVVIKETAWQLEEVVVTATYNQASATGLYAKQQKMAALSDGVSSDLIKKTSDNNVAQVLRRVVGVTLDHGKYVNIRGMGERYNNVQLNGAALPGTEPNRRNFAFDVIPTGLVDNVTISKTFTPDMQGEFTGGMVDVNTLAVPDRRFLTVSAGTGMNTVATGKEFYLNKRFDKDWLFGDIEGRKWYSGYLAADMEQTITKAGEMNTYGQEKSTAMPVQNYTLTLGLPFDLGGSSLGIVAALTYRHEESTEKILEGKMVTLDTLYRPGGHDSYRYKATTATGAILNAGWKSDNHELHWRNLFNNRFSHTNLRRFVFKYYEGIHNVEYYASPLQARLWQTQLDGKHELFGGKIVVGWNASHNDVTRTNPDDRLVRGDLMGITPDSTLLINWGSASGPGNSNQYSIGGGHIMYSHLHETKKNAGANLEFPFIVRANRQSLKAGYLGTFREGRYEQRYLKPKGGTGSGVYPSLEELYSPESFASGKMVYRASGVNGPTSDGYDGEQEIHAGYLMGDFGFLKRVRLIAGARVEATDMRVSSLTGGGEGGYSEHDTLDRVDWLPSATLVYTITPGLNLRAAYSKTLARLDFRELSNNTYYNVEDRVTVQQSGKLVPSHTYNHDARVEWYPRAGEVVSAGYFYKKFVKPVEMMLRVSADGQNRYHLPENLEEATARGVEINWRKSFDFLASLAPACRDIYFTGNYTWLDAHVEFTSTGGGGNLTRDRPLMGLSPYLVNLGLAYEGAVVGAAVNYNRLGRKLVVAGADEYEDQYEHPRDVLDLQLSTRLFKKRLELKFNLSDLLDQDVIVYWNRAANENGVYIDNTDQGLEYNEGEGDSAMSRIKKGANLSISASYTF